MSKLAVFIIYGFSLLCIGFDFSGNRYSIKLKKQIFDFFCFILILGATLKPSDFCFDVNNYYMFFNEIDPIYSYHYKFGEFEPAYSYLNAIVKTFTNNYHVLFFVLSFIDVMLYRRIILKYADKIFLALFVYISSFFFANEMVVLRFAISSAIVFLNMENLEKGNFKKFFFFCFLATTFHYSAVSSFIFFLFRKPSKEKRNVKLLIFLIIFMGGFSTIISPIGLIALLAKKVPSLYDAGLWHLLRYIGKEESAGIKRIIIYIPYVYLALLMYINSKRNNYCCYNNIAYGQLLYILVAILFMLVFYEVASMSRINQLFLTSVILISGNMILSHKKYKDLKMLYLLGILVLQIYVFLRQNFFNSSGLMLYN